MVKWLRLIRPGVKAPWIDPVIPFNKNRPVSGYASSRLAILTMTVAPDIKLTKKKKPNKNGRPKINVGPDAKKKNIYKQKNKDAAIRHRLSSQKHEN